MAIGFVHRGDATALVGGGIDNSGIGAAWVFIRNGGSWIQQGSKLVASGTVGGASQGTSVSLSADGNTAIVGGCLDNGNIGAAWVFIRNVSKGRSLSGVALSDAPIKASPSR